MRYHTPCLLLAGLGLIFGAGPVSARPKQAKPTVSLTAEGQKLEDGYAASLKELQAEIASGLPSANPRKKDAFEQAVAHAKQAKAQADAAQQALNKVGAGGALVAHAKNKWIGGANKGIARAEAALKNASSDEEREAANKELAKWQANKEEGLKALKDRQAAWDKAKAEEPQLRKANVAAQAAFAKAQAQEQQAFKDFFADLDPFLKSDKGDAKLVKATVLAEATPAGLAEFAQDGADKQALVEKLLADPGLMKDMLVAGGARFGKYGRAMEIYTAIQQASTQAKDGVLQRLALATSLEHARPIAQSNPREGSSAPATVDPVKRYLHYEKAFLADELDPAFKYLAAWDYRHVINSDAPDEMLTWGRDMLRNYRPDHIYNKDYGWRYVSAVKTEVPYGSQNVKYDDPSLHQYQNIAMNGGICGRRAFFGRFILRSFGIPTWGVTQRAHAAVGHWTPKGWVVVLGAGFNASWWDKDDVSLSGTQFLLETQARAQTPEDYLKVQRAQWVSRVLGEPAYNERRKVDGGFWSSVGYHQSVLLASKAVTLGPLGQELAEANEREQKVVSAAVSADDRQIAVKNGSIVIPAVAHGAATGKSAAMKSFSGGMQLHSLGGFKTQYEVTAPQAGTYALRIRVATVQKGQQFLLAANDAKDLHETDVPYTLGMWQETEPVEVALEKGKNILHFGLKDGSRGVTIKDLTLTALE
jgi:predicted  nucleic acid-binding Zn-ribbon protein